MNNTITQTVTMVTNTGLAALTMNPTLSGDIGYSIATSTSCGQSLAPGASCKMVLSYTPKTVSAPAMQSATLNMGFGDVPTGTPQTVVVTGTSAPHRLGKYPKQTTRR